MSGEPARKVVPAGRIGLAAAAVLALSTPLIARHEGLVLATYRDPAAILTSCYGHTGAELREGQTFSMAQCLRTLDADQARTLRALGACTRVEVPVESFAAFTAFGFNVGAGTYCKNFAPLVNRGDLAGACAKLSLYVYAKGRRLPGLVTRRARERALCERGAG